MPVRLVEFGIDTIAIELDCLKQTGGCLTRAFIHQYRWRTTHHSVLMFIPPLIFCLFFFWKA